MNNIEENIIIVGAGFGGLYAAKELLKSTNRFKVILIDKRNFHLFQPLLYQVATAQLSPEDISYPVREIFKNNANITILKDEVKSIDLDNKFINVECGKINYSKLIISTGVAPDYFGNFEWEKIVPPLKTLEDALVIRRKILNVFERAESEMLHPVEKIPLNFVIIGGGPTGVELAGALAELRKYSLKNEFRKINPERAKIYLIEAGNRILSNFPNKLNEKAKEFLEKLEVTVKTDCLVTSVHDGIVELKKNGELQTIESNVVIWTAGVKAYYGNNIIGLKGINLDKKGRIEVTENLTIPNYKDVYVIGDISKLVATNNINLPGTAPVAIQQGTYAAKHIKNNGSISDFKYRDKGNLAVIGRNAAIADFGFIKLSGFFAWIIWVFVHIGYLIGFNNRLLVMIKWGWNYFFKKQTSRIIYRSNNNR